MIIKGRSLTVRHVVTESTWTQKSKSRMSNPKTNSQTLRDEWHNLLHLLNIMNDTAFSCSHFSNSHSFLSAGKQSEMSKRSQESSSLGSPTAKARACCLVSREFTRKVVQKMKDRHRHDESSSDISMNSEKMHISTRTRFMTSSMQAALRMDPSYEKNLELFKNSEFESIKGLFGITRLMIEGNSEIKNVLTADVASSLQEKQIVQKQEISFTRTRCHAWEKLTVQKKHS